MAYSGLADTHALTYVYHLLAPEESREQAKSAFQKALRLDNSLAEAQKSVGHLSEVFDGDLGKAERACQRAISIDPDYATAHHWYSALLDSILLALSVIIVGAAELGSVFLYAKQSIVTAYVAIGFIVGTSGLAVIRSADYIEVRTHFGVILTSPRRTERRRVTLRRSMRTPHSVNTYVEGKESKLAIAWRAVSDNRPEVAVTCPSRVTLAGR